MDYFDSRRCAQVLNCIPTEIFVANLSSCVAVYLFTQNGCSKTTALMVMTIVMLMACGATCGDVAGGGGGGGGGSCAIGSGSGRGDECKRRDAADDEDDDDARAPM